MHFLEEHQSYVFKEDMIKEGIEDQNDDCNINQPYKTYLSNMLTMTTMLVMTMPMKWVYFPL